ncbi:BofC C-terminal domain-containing protein [Brevibacillus dissolubilis]|uniref:BofC C-terminal domain-containing protein n=1 Tax=Brevibacillus dissolubilis TaxID=1844116 RepID=UPI0011171B3B|nr:BofC C-terminal domain-containing protein [Brevibacillus dissolubilis]
MKKRHWLFFFTWTVLLIGVIGGGTWYLNHTIKELQHTGETTISAKNQDNGKAVPVDSNSRKLVLSRTYLCGMKDEEQKMISDVSLEQLLKTYIGWEIAALEADKVVLHRRENDIAPACKEHGYFGLSPDGMLTLFNGVPSDRNVIQTFYQINTSRMQVSLPKEEIEQLKKGIRIRDLAEYNSVLSTYGEFQEEEMLDGH